jgi:formylglycine-generating enzyme required for sulfatase activity
LPTEAEWEYACRAGTTTAYFWGDTITPNNANYEVSGGQSRDVGQYAANPWGFYDMHGNIGEWVNDWIGSYPTSHVTDPTGPLSAYDRVFRGSTFIHDGSNLRSAGRYNLPPSSRGHNIGFRLAFKQQ